MVEYLLIHKPNTPHTLLHHIIGYRPADFQLFTMMDIDQLADPSTGVTRINHGGSGTLSSEASRLFRVYKTVGAMLSKRGYMVSREMREMTPKNFTDKFGEFPSREGLTILVVSNAQIFVMALFSIKK
jgi:hypothetical protein